MIGLLDRTLLIATPSKCGSERLIKTLTRTGLAVHIPEKHGWRQEDGYGCRALLVRDPLERWVSTYWWIKSTPTLQGYRQLAKVMSSFKTFTEWLAQRASRSYVFQPLTRYIEEFNPERFIPLERLMVNWDDWLPSTALGVYRATVPHKTRGRLLTTETVDEGVALAFRSLLAAEYATLAAVYPKGPLG